MKSRGTRGGMHAGARECAARWRTANDGHRAAVRALRVTQFWPHVVRFGRAVGCARVCVCARDMREVVNIATIDRRPTLRALDPTPTISPVVPIQRAVT